jgi:hypothetical protein
MQSKKEVIGALEAALEYLTSDVAVKIEGETASLPSKDLVRLIQERDRAVTDLAKMLDAINSLSEGIIAWKKSFKLDEIVQQNIKSAEAKDE